MSGWRLYGLIFLVGLVSAFGQAPFHFFPLMFLTFPVLVFALDGAAADAKKRGFSTLVPAFCRGWMFGFGYFVGGLWWMGSAFLVNPDRFALLLPLGVMGLPAFLAIFFGVASALARRFWCAGPSRILTLAIALALTEWLRGFILTGFPWNNLGYLVAFNDTTMQGLALVGTPVYAFLAVLIFSTPVALGDFETARSERRSTKGSQFLISATVLTLIAIFGYGHLRFMANPVSTDTVEGVNLRIVQPNIAQKDKFDGSKARDILLRHLELSERITAEGDLGLLETTHLIWPESAFPFILTNHPEVLERIGQMLPSGTVLLTGAVREERAAERTESDRYFNSVYVIDDRGTIRDAYDKVHLVPFGEYLPFQSVLESWGLLSFIEVPGGFQSGPKQQVVKSGSAPPFLPMICYEVIFPVDLKSDKQLNSARWILNVTNDAWFGITSGPFQHFHQTRIRAVEEGLPVIRAANNGISAVIDPFGRVLDKISLGKSGIIDANLPKSIKLQISDELRIILFWTVLAIAVLIRIFTLLSRKY